MELTKEEQVFVLQMLQQVSFQQAEAKIQAGQLQLEIEASLADQETQTLPDTPAPDNS